MPRKQKKDYSKPSKRDALRIFFADDPLAPFRLARMVEIAGEPYTELPDAVIEYLGSIAARYFAEAREAVRQGQKPPSLDKIAGLSGMKTTPWKAEIRRFQSQLLRFHFDSLTSASRETPHSDYSPLAIRARRLFPNVTHTLHFTDGVSRPVPILDERRRPTREFQVALGKMIGIRGSSDEAIYRNVRRLLRLQ